MDVYIYKLKFKGPTHFGETGIDLENVNEWVSSDTLFSALINAMSLISSKDKVTEFVNIFKQQPPFLVSSLFLYSDDICFLPRPKDDSHIPVELRKDKGKEIKKLKWLDATGFKKWISGVHLGEDDLNSLVSLQQAYRDMFKIERRPRVSIDRVTQNSNIYHCGYVYFKDRAGLYGFVSFNDLSTVEPFRKLLTALGETGLGGEKTYGCGLFGLVSMEKVSGVFNEILFHDVKTYTLLSLYHPSEQEITDIGNALIAYDVVRGRGWITSGRYALPLKRKSVGFFTEGSVLSSKPGGCLVDVTPEGASLDTLQHGIYRYGYAFTAPIGR